MAPLLGHSTSTVVEVAEKNHGRAWPVGAKKRNGSQRDCWDWSPLPCGGVYTMPAGVKQAGSPAEGKEAELAKHSS